MSAAAGGGSSPTPPSTTGWRRLASPSARVRPTWPRRRLADAGLGTRLSVEICDYRELEDWGSFDKIVSVGMFEHVGRQKLPVFFHRAFRLLKPGGLFLNHGIASVYLPEVGPLEGLVRRALYSTGGFIRNYVFPDGELLPISYTLETAERAGFEVRDVESLREHYALTLRHWLRALEEKADEARIDRRRAHLSCLALVHCRLRLLL